MADGDLALVRAVCLCLNTNLLHAGDVKVVDSSADAVANGDKREEEQASESQATSDV